MNWLRKTTVGRRCDQKALPQRFLAQPDGLHGLRPCAALVAQFSSSLFPSASFATSVFKFRSEISALIREIRGKNLTGRCFGHKRTQKTQRGFLYDPCDPLWLKKSDPKILAPISVN